MDLDIKDDTMKLLLTSVFGPYGVDDEYGRKENIMELFHNQVTREQGIFSFRLNHESAGLHLMAENISIPTVILDFPSQKKFINEIKKGYDYIGISFIVPNFVKAKKMAQLIREISPKTKIILGGHGTSIENIKDLIPCDHTCRGDGVRFLRQLFNENVNAPIKHPMLYSAFNKHLMGVPLKQDGGVIMTGVGCANSCRFCCTTHYFQKVYTPFFKTGKEIFDLCVKMEEKLGVTNFFIMDENFLKSESRARELVSEIEKHKKRYSFNIFSSAETVTHMGVNFLERLGVDFLWMGAESQKEVYEKNKGIDFKALIKDLRDHGISVLASGILFLEDHDKETIHDDITFMTDLNADMVQFMQLGPLPGTKLYKDYDKQGKLRKDIPYEEWHGQHQLWFKHPHFTREESADYLKNAFIREYETNGPSILRMADTIIRGVYASQNDKTGLMKLRHEKCIDRAKEIRPLVDVLYKRAHNRFSRELAKDIRMKYNAFFGKPPFLQHIKSLAIHGLVMAEEIRSKFVYNNIRQPFTLVTPYRIELKKVTTGKPVNIEKKWLEPSNLNIEWETPLVPAHLSLSGILDNENIEALKTSIVTFLKEDEKSLILDFSDLQKVEEDALRNLFNQIEKYSAQIKLKYSNNIESTKQVIEKTIEEFKMMGFVTA